MLTSVLKLLFVYVKFCFFSPTFTQNKTRYVAGDPSHSGDEEEDGERGPGRYEELEHSGERLKCHGSEENWLSSKPTVTSHTIKPPQILGLASGLGPAGEKSLSNRWQPDIKKP